MKKLSLALALIGASTLVNAQNSAVTSAYAHLEDFRKDKDTADLAQAKTYIDQATTNEKTANEAKTFLYRGEIYQEIFENAVNSVQTKILKADPKTPLRDAKNTAYAKADTTALGVAAYSYVKVIQIDPKGDYADDAKAGLIAIGNSMINKAVADDINKNYASSFVFFERVHVGQKARGGADTGALYKQILQYTAQTAELSKNYPKAIMYYKEMAGIKGGSYSYNDVPYTTLYRLYLIQNDTNNALAIAEQGHQMFPDNINLLNLETNGYLWRNQNDKAVANLQSTIDKLNGKAKRTPDDDTLESHLYAIMANVYDQQANPRDAKNNLLPEPANYLDLFQKADTNYRLSIKYNKNFYDAYFSIGAMYNNRVFFIYKEMNDITDKNPRANTKKQEDEAKALLLKAQPYFETAYKMKPDQQTKVALLKLYENTGQEDKAKAMTAEQK